MTPLPQIFKIEFPSWRSFTWGDGVVLAGLVVLLFLGVRVGMQAPMVIQGPEINLAPAVLPYYITHSLRRMAIAYALSLSFSLIYGSLAANHRLAEKILLPLLDILQSVPILSFLPVVLLSLVAVLPLQLALELSSIILIFTSQVWNLTFAWYQSLTTIPRDLQRTSVVLGFNSWLRFKTLELPFAAITLIWNSVASWAGGWFFLMAAEIFAAGDRNFRLPGLGAYLQEAASQGDLTALAWGLGSLVLTIVALDQFIWRPLLAWSDRFKMQLVESEIPPTSWVYNALRSSRVYAFFSRRFIFLPWQRLDERLTRLFPAHGPDHPGKSRPHWFWYVLGSLLVLVMAYEGYRGGRMLLGLSLGQWQAIVIGLAATFIRVFVALLIALAWTIPTGVAIGTNPRLAKWLQPLVQVIASVPATALFPALVLIVLRLPGGLNLAAVLLMLLGTQWYLLFNIIAGASAIPQDLKYTTALLQLGRWERWRTLILPAIFPFVITGSITACGGAWNASIVAEYTQFGGKIMHTTGVGAIISQATAAGDYPLLLAATLALILAVSTTNRLLWRRLYRVAEERYRME